MQLRHDRLTAGLGERLQDDADIRVTRLRAEDRVATHAIQWFEYHVAVL